jgi:hypothetical protein
MTQRETRKAKMRCRFSGSAEIPQQDPHKLLLPVECPECGAIRRPVQGWQKIPQTYGEHQELDGTAHRRTAWWKRVDGAWQLVGDKESEKSNEAMDARR